MAQEQRTLFDVPKAKRDTVIVLYNDCTGHGQNCHYIAVVKSI